MNNVKKKTKIVFRHGIKLNVKSKLKASNFINFIKTYCITSMKLSYLAINNVFFSQGNPSVVSYAAAPPHFMTNINLKYFCLYIINKAISFVQPVPLHMTKKSEY